MKKAGEVLSVLFDRQFAEKALGYSKLFNSWIDITEKNGIGSASAHSRIIDLDKGILLIEIDHPGWKQILQTKQSKLLNDFRYRFPKMNITAISLMLNRRNQNEEFENKNTYNFQTENTLADINNIEFNVKETGFEAIKDEDFRKKLKQLGRFIKEKEKKNAGKN